MSQDNHIHPSSERRFRASLLAMVAAFPLVCAAGVYKHVAPDGKVTFSDTAPVSAPSQPNKKTAPGAAAATSIKPTTPAAATAPALAPAPAPAAGKSAPANEQDTVLRNATLGAAIKLKIVGALVDGIGNFCVREQPAAAVAVRAAQAQWHEQHDPLAPAMRKIFEDLAPVQLRSDQERQLKAATNDQLRPLFSAPKQEQLRRCQRAPTDFGSAAMNLANSPATVKLFNDFVPGKWQPN